MIALSFVCLIDGEGNNPARTSLNKKIYHHLNELDGYEISSLHRCTGGSSLGHCLEGDFIKQYTIFENLKTVDCSDSCIFQLIFSILESFYVKKNCQIRFMRSSYKILP
jgi:hypothetical protein